ncbi:MAG TPA: NAD(P)/FAD-dependent oxidoreductase [Gammaproteobacteria bacterium]|nr:NAD(P)/FAD-dependent oxidoreductase [Gammaproteobacteria bacterium]
MVGSTNIKHTSVLVIGAGPSGAIASTLIKQQGIDVVVLEKSHFPRFSIGESLLPQCMEFIEQAGMLEAVRNEGFQYKDGAAFCLDSKYATFDFQDKFSPGHGTTFQVPRGRFDHVLANEAIRQGVDIHYGYETTGMDFFPEYVELHYQTDNGDRNRITADFVLDASGFGRVVPRLLNLESPSHLPVRSSLFTHVTDNSPGDKYDRNKILITVHPEHKDVWYWTIPFSNGNSSIGVVAEPYLLDQTPGDNKAKLKEFIHQAPNLRKILANAEYFMDVGKLTGYSADVKSLYGDRFALLGNAGEFLDPVFSSGVTIALKSASLAAPLVVRQINGDSVDWEKEYSVTLRQGIDTFRTFVNAWYDGHFQDIIFHPEQQSNVRAMISSILAGYAWDANNPFVAESKRRLNALVEHCRGRH